MVEAIPKTHMGLIPHLTVSDGRKAIEFYKKAFGAVEVAAMPGPDGKIMHAEMRINDVPFFLNDEYPEMTGGKEQNPLALGATSVTIHQYVANCDAAIDRARQAGAEVTGPATDMFWGDRYGNVRDPFGHLWSFATHIKDVTPQEMTEAMNKSFV